MKYLHLSENDIGDIGAQHLSKAFKANAILEVLSFSCNNSITTYFKKQEEKTTKFKLSRQNAKKNWHGGMTSIYDRGDVPEDMADYTKKFHSKVRWGKELAEIEPFLKAKPDGINCKDATNGNTPIHIAAENGHFHQ